MSDLIGGNRPIRFCPLCKQADDHPRHVRGDEDENLARHMDCCAAAGCPDGTCVVITADSGGVTGAAFLDHILSLDHEAVAAKVAEIPNDPNFRIDPPEGI
jgi:hypothetical protein